MLPAGTRNRLPLLRYPGLGLRLLRRIPAVVPLFEPASKATALQGHAEVIWAGGQPLAGKLRWHIVRSDDLGMRLHHSLVPHH